MRSTKSIGPRTLTLLVPLLLSAALGACGQTSSPPPPESSGCPVANTSCSNAAGPKSIPSSSAESIPLYVADQNTTGHWGYPNEPLVSVTICAPNHTSASQCQTVSNILLDTGSFGLRIFASALSGSGSELVQRTVVSGGKTLGLAECALFGSGTDWGPVEGADVIVGSEEAGDISIQVIDSKYGSIPASCADLCPDTDPCSTGFNGILGVGPFVQDCGSNCAGGEDMNNPGIYFGCDGTGCFNANHGGCGGDGVCVLQVPLDQQVRNPVASFSSGHNNGLSVTLPPINPSGSSAITSGSVAFGIGSPNSVTVYPADPNGMIDGKGMDFATQYNGANYGYGSSNDSIAFLDSGSNGIFFPGGLATCPEGAGFFCPASIQALNAAITGYDGDPSGGASFSIGNAQSLFGSGMSAFDNVGGPASGMFDWGLPFFFGKTIYIGISGMSATINGASATGPYWAF